MRTSLPCLGLACALALPPIQLRGQSLAVGRSERTIQAGQTTWQVHAYKPDCYRDGPLVVVFHGSDRDPSLARDNAVPLAHAGCAIVIAPLFDADRFPRWAYQFGGLGDVFEDEAGRRFRLRPTEQRTGRLVLDLIDALRKAEGHPEMPYLLIGHSAGAQFLGRFAAFHPNEARRIVLANPGSYLAPSWSSRFPYGFGGMVIGSEADRQRYLASPVVIVLAGGDVSRNGLDKSPGAERQGPNRYERGHNVFWQAQRSAAAGHAMFGWSLLEVPGLGHGSGKLYARPEIADALFGSLSR